MPLHIEVSELADRQIDEADRWSREHRDKAPDAIREELERIGSLIAFQPLTPHRKSCEAAVCFSVLECNHGMKIILSILGILVLSACGEQRREDGQTGTVVATTSTASSQPAVTQTIAQTSGGPVNAAPAAEESIAENGEHGTWVGQVAVAHPVSMFNYVGAESGDFAPMRFDNESEAGKKILSACPDGSMCEFTGVIEWLDEVPPPDASAIGRIIRVDSAKRVSAAVP